MFGLDSLFSAGASLLGGIFGQDQTNRRQEDAQQFNAEQSAINRAFNADEAAKNRSFTSAEAGYSRDFNSTEAKMARDFSEMMSNSAWQRGVSDMKKAGINPILAYSKGGASAPVGTSASGPAASGSSASGSAASSGYTEAKDIVSPAVQSAMAMKMNTATVDNLREQNNLLKLQAQQTLATTAKTMAEQNQINANTRVTEAVLPKVQEEALSAKYDNSAKRADSEQRDTFAGEWARRIGTSAKDIMSVIPFTGR